MASNSIKTASPCPPLSQAVMAALMTFGWTLAVGMASNNVFQFLQDNQTHSRYELFEAPSTFSHSVFQKAAQCSWVSLPPVTHLSCIIAEEATESLNSCIEVEIILGEQTYVLETLVVTQALAVSLWDFLEDCWPRSNTGLNGSTQSWTNSIRYLSKGPLRFNKLNNMTDKGLEAEQISFANSNRAFENSLGLNRGLCAGRGPLSAQALTIQVGWDLSCKPPGRPKAAMVFVMFFVCLIFLCVFWGSHRIETVNKTPKRMRSF